MRPLIKRSRGASASLIPGTLSGTYRETKREGLTVQDFINNKINFIHSTPSREIMSFLPPTTSRGAC